MALITSVVLALVIAAVATASLTTAQKDAIVARHNKLRSDAATRANSTHASYQPCTAADMEMMVWDETLATESQTYADLCVGDHHADAGRLFGENLFMTFPTSTYNDADLVGSAQGWYDEIVDTVFAISDTQIASKPLSQCVDTAGESCNVGHYYQMIWAKSNKIGCGVKSCKSGFMISGGEYNTGVLLVCRYTSAASQNKGKTVGLPYLLGTPCAACPGHCSTNPPGLCTSAPTRCADKTMSAPPDCSTLKAQCSMMEQIKEFCPLSCGTCTVPSGIGTSTALCKAGSGSGSGSSGDHDHDHDHEHEGSGTKAPTGSSSSSTATVAPTAKKYTGSFDVQMSKAHADKLVANLAKAKEAFAHAYAKTHNIATSLVVIKRILLDGVEVTTAGGRRLADAVIKVEYEMTTTKSNLAPPSAALATTLKTNIAAEAAEIDSSIVVKDVPTSGWSQASTPSEGSASAAVPVAMMRVAPMAVVMALLLCGLPTVA